MIHQVFGISGSTVYKMLCAEYVEYKHISYLQCLAYELIVLNTVLKLISFLHLYVTFLMLSDNEVPSRGEKNFHLKARPRFPISVLLIFSLFLTVCKLFAFIRIDHYGGVPSGKNVNIRKLNPDFLLVVCLC